MASPSPLSALRFPWSTMASRGAAANSCTPLAFSSQQTGQGVLGTKSPGAALGMAGTSALRGGHAEAALPGLSGFQAGSVPTAPDRSLLDSACFTGFFPVPSPFPSSLGALLGLPLKLTTCSQSLVLVGSASGDPSLREAPAAA